MNRDDIFKKTSDFKQLTVVHRNQHEAKKRIEFLCDFGVNTSLIVLAGPTGAGKSTLLDVFVREYITRAATDLAQDSNLIPLIYTVATASGHKAFDWKRLFIDALTDIHDPFGASRLNKKTGHPEPDQRFLSKSRTAAILRAHFEHEAELRGLKVWIIDEAHHLVRGGQSGTPGDQLDVLKSVSQRMGVTILLAGTYDLPDYMATSGQLSRRSEVVRIDRYKWDRPEDRKVFASVVNKLLNMLPMLEGRPDVTDRAVAELFYVCSLGCVGICKDWIARAFSLMLQEDKRELTLEHLHKTRLSDTQLRSMIAELQRGEDKVSWGNGAAPNAALSREILSGAAAPKKAARTAAPSTKKSPNNPGTRNPSRSPVGNARSGDSSSAGAA